MNEENGNVPEVAASEDGSETAESLRRRLRESNTGHSLELALVRNGVRSTAAARALIDNTLMRLDGEGICENAAELAESLKKQHPWLFEAARTVAATAIQQGVATSGDYSKMTDEEYYSLTSGK